LLRSEAAFSLWQIEQRAEAVPVLDAVLREGLGSRRQDVARAASRAAECLSLIGPAARAAVPALREALASDNQWVRVHAARALWRIEGRGEEVVPALLEEIRGRPAGLLAVECLGQIGPPARAAIPALRRAVDSAERLIEVSSTDRLASDDESFRAAARRALDLIERA